MANEPRKPQIVPLAKIHDLPGVFIPKVQDKAYGGLVTSIQVSGVKEAVRRWHAAPFRCLCPFFPKAGKSGCGAPSDRPGLQAPHGTNRVSEKGRESWKAGRDDHAEGAGRRKCP